MIQKNTTQVSEFLLHGFSSQPEVQTVLFFLFLSMYLLNLIGNITIILSIRCDMQLLRTPMYFFLSYLALADMGFASTIIPKALQTLASHKKTISYCGCLIQMFFYIYFGNADSYLLASMAYDRYAAICQPMYYSTMMSHKRCLQLAAVSWTVPMIHSLLYTILMARVEFCHPGEIRHFICDIYPVLEVSCSETKVIDFVLLTEGMVEILGPFVLIIVSYALIFYSIMKLPSAVEKHKAFSTCGSHISVVVLFYGGVSWVYFKPNAKNPSLQDMIATVMYTMVIPMLNPFIYTLRNSTMKSAIRRVIRQHFH
ncbi:olfactory receptor 1L1-like [Sphaerodactylus townsendi]|uniref:olfactory receptor 1L1-like n=1 Tax=Sphaerodactylus townsendi TaxID=933632 RepID=UPI002025CEEE|nr:olfactory receptor 1L1-like [Sphaerodactylus townsendi]